MFHRIWIVSSLILAFAVPAFAQPQTKLGTALISGRVTLNGEPATGVFVGLQPRPTSPGGGPFVPDRSQYLRAQTDAEGRFSFPNLSAGQYQVVALAPGFVSADDSPLYSGKMVNLTDGESLSNLELRLKRGAIITGRITDPSGNPVIEKDVQLVKMDARGNFTRFNFGPPEMARTDDRGVYRIHSLPAGKYKVSIGYSAQEGFRSGSGRLYYTKTYHPHATAENQAKVIDLREGSEITDVDIKIAEAKKSYDVSGKVIEAETGKLVAGIRIGYSTVQPDGTLSGSISIMSATDAQGEFQLQGILPGKYLVFADSRDSQTPDFYSDQTPVELGDADATDVEVKVHRGGSISGMAVVEGVTDPAILKLLSGLNLFLTYRSREANLGSRGQRPGADGSFRFSGVRPGKVNLQAFSPGEGLKQLRVEHNGAPVTDGLELQQGESLTNVRIVFGYGTGVIRGQLKLVGGTLPEGAGKSISIRFASGSGSEFYAPVDARNQFVVKNLPPGEYELKLSVYAPNATPELARMLATILKITQRVTVGNGETPAEFVLDLSQKENNE